MTLTSARSIWNLYVWQFSGIFPHKVWSIQEYNLMILSKNSSKNKVFATLKLEVNFHQKCVNVKWLTACCLEGKFTFLKL